MLRNSQVASYYSLNISVDLYGLEAKENIVLNRSSITDDGKKNVNEICDELIQLFSQETLRSLKVKADSHAEDHNFRGFSFWMICSPE